MIGLICVEIVLCSGCGVLFWDCLLFFSLWVCLVGRAL